MRGATIACVLALLAWVPPAMAQPRPPVQAAVPVGNRPSVARLADVKAVRERLGLVPDYENVPGVDALKIAVLDFGFAGLGPGRAYLPESAEVVEHYDPEFVRRFGLGDPDYRKPFEPFNRHGREMAQIVWAVTGSRPGGPKFLLLNANGPTMLRRAVRLAIERRVDIILFSGSFEGGGNGDGRGPINRVVDEALSRDILWINAAGNFGSRVYSGPVRVLADGYLRLRNGSDVASLRFRNKADENTITVTLTWNDYRDDEDAGTDKDLDLDVEDWAGRPIGSGKKVQVGGDRAPGPEESRNPRERVVLADLAANPYVPTDPDYGYRIRVRARRGRFAPTDRLRILLTPSRDDYIPPGGSVPEEAVAFVDANGEDELYPPADDPRVLTVGDSSPGSSLGPTADRRVKPDAILDDSRAYFTDGQVTFGSSNAAAYLAGVAALLKAAEPGLRPRHLLRIAQQGQTLADAMKAPASAADATDARASALGLARSPRGRAHPDIRVWRTPGRTRLSALVFGDR